jgi:hypothetical protein
MNLMMTDVSHLIRSWDSCSGLIYCTEGMTIQSEGSFICGNTLIDPSAKGARPSRPAVQVLVASNLEYDARTAGGYRALCGAARAPISVKRMRRRNRMILTNVPS